MSARVKIPPSPRVAIGIAVGIGAAGYAWWATGVRPFRAWADVAVAIPAALLALAAWRETARSGRGAGRPMRAATALPAHPYGALPWIALGLAAVGLEVAALALGGRSRAVPTLSTVADQALAWHVSRWLAFAFWLAVGTWPLRRVTGTDR
jgi:hypothetical protein